jgi:hypothetical protein
MLLLLIAAWWGATPSHADGAYTATASASLVNVDFTTVPGVVFDQLINAGASVAQAQIDSLGDTSAFAAEPYPSASVVALPALAAGLGVSGLPSYPLIASSNAGIPASRTTAGPIVLTAKSTTGMSAGSVTDGATAGSATVDVDPSSGVVEARALTSVSGVEATSTLTIDGVTSTAAMSVSPSGKTTVTSSFAVATLNVLGTTIAVTPSELTVFGRSVNLGIDPAGILGPLLSALAARGTTIQYVPATRTADSITSAGLRILSTQTTPDIRGVSGGLQSVNAEIDVGFASASVTAGAVPPPAADATPGSPPTAMSPDATGVATAIASGPAASGPESDAASGVTQASPGLAPSGEETGTRGVRSDSDSAAALGHIALAIPLGRFYPVLVLAAAIGVVVVSLIRHLGVRNP